MIPKVVIVGRPNVGKSSLMNMLANKRVSIVDPTAGVTRDRVSFVTELTPLSNDDPPRFVELIDTGGHGIEDAQQLTDDVENQITLGMSEASVILFMVDAQQGVAVLDEQVARLLRRYASGTPIVLVANKVDGPTHEAGAYEAMSLGFGEPVLVSAATGYHKHELLEALHRAIDWDKLGAMPVDRDPTDPGMYLAIVGKRNAGKSTLVNQLAGAPRVIVSQVEGTTRDSVDVRFEIDGHRFTAIDTAGVRKQKSLEGDIEFYSHHRSMRSIRRADVVLLMVDASVPVSQVDKQLGHEVLKHFKPCVIVVNKWDLAEENYTQEQYLDYLDDSLRGFRFAPIVFTSAQNNQGVRDAVAMALNLYEQAGHRVTTGELNRVMERILAERTPSSKVGKRPRVYYVSQLDVHPPTIALFVNDPQMFTPEYERFLINRLRDELPFSEVPIKILIRQRHSAPRGQSAAAAPSDATLLEADLLDDPDDQDD